jgi:eukaryotic-like serine/threonine-protein kinase
VADLPSQLSAALADRYRFERELGRGGMATVYLAHDLKHRRRVALKVLHPELAYALGADRFLREIEVAANLTHPHILPLHDSGEAGGLLYYVMPYVEGESLRDRLRRETQLPLDEAVQIAREVADALAYAHGQGIVHRDIKPENILLSSGHALVADFGIARALGQAGAERLTETGMAVGTAVYMSPEQASGERHVDGRSDVYSLGCVLYEMLAGEPPYTGPSAQAIVAKRFSDPVPSVRRLRPAVPNGLDNVITKALALVAADRFTTAGDFVGALAAPGASAASSVAAAPFAGALIQAPSVVVDSKAAADIVGKLRAAWLARRSIIAGTIIAGTMILLVVAATVLSKRRVPAPRSDPNLIAVAPFRVTSTDSALDYLREGMVDLLSTKLTGEGGPRAADPRSVLSAWRRASRSDAGDPPRNVALEVAGRLGASQLLLGNVVGASGGVVLNATVLTVPDGERRAETSVEGPADSLPILVDRLAAKLLSLGAGEGEQRLTSLTSTSLPALRAYLDGQAMYRRGQYAEAVTSFMQALQFDSTFALAALGLLAGGNRTGIYEAVFRGRDLVWAARDRLSPRDHAYMMALIGQGYSDTTSYSQMLGASERFVKVAPDRVEAWTSLGDVLLWFGEHLGIPRAQVRAASAYRQAVELDPTFAPALDNLMIVAARSGDTATIRRLGKPYLATDSVGGPREGAADLVRWRVAVALADTAALRSVRARFGTMSVDNLLAIGQLGQYDGVALEDAERAQGEWLRRESRTSYRIAVLAEISALALNRGRPSVALRLRQEAAEAMRESNTPAMERILDALYWDGDSTVGAAAARELSATAGAPLVDEMEGPGSSCVLEQWRLAHKQLANTPRTITNLRSATESREGIGIVALSQGCAILLEALLAAAERRPDAGVYLVRLDSLMRTGPPYRWIHQSWNLVIARLKEAQGDRQGALAATRRRLYYYAEPLFLSTYLREEGRLAALTGDRAGAIRAYQHFLALRSDPEAALESQVKQVRAELTRLRGETSP